MVSPNTKNTHIGISAILVEKKKRSIHFSFSDPTMIFLKNLRIARTIPMMIPTKWNLYPYGESKALRFARLLSGNHMPFSMSKYVYEPSRYVTIRSVGNR